MNTFFPLDGVRTPVPAPPGVSLIESGLSGFSEESSEALSFPFSVLGDCTTPSLVLDLPHREMVSGTGKGYVVELIQGMKDVGYQHVTPMLVNVEEFGSPVRMQRLFLLGSRVGPPNVPEGSFCCPLSHALPDVVFHALRETPRQFLQPGFHHLNGFVSSSENPLSSPDSWGDKLPLIERRVGDTLVTSRLGWLDIQVLWGFVPANHKVRSLSKVTPSSALSKILGQCN